MLYYVWYTYVYTVNVYSRIYTVLSLEFYMATLKKNQLHMCNMFKQLP